MVRRLPEELQGKLPEPKQIEQLVEAVEVSMQKEDAGMEERT
jgi:hypothetical protein